jgi:hypothetical protein
MIKFCLSNCSVAEKRHHDHNKVLSKNTFNCGLATFSESIIIMLGRNIVSGRYSWELYPDWQRERKREREGEGGGEGGRERGGEGEEDGEGGEREIHGDTCLYECACAHGSWRSGSGMLITLLLISELSGNVGLAQNFVTGILCLTLEFRKLETQKEAVHPLLQVPASTWALASCPYFGRNVSQSLSLEGKAWSQKTWLGSLVLVFNDSVIQSQVGGCPLWTPDYSSMRWDEMLLLSDS